MNPLTRTVRRATGAKTGYGWHCDPCKINAGHPDDPFATFAIAEEGYFAHVRDSHGRIEPDGARVDEITWR